MDTFDELNILANTLKQVSFFSRCYEICYAINNFFVKNIYF